jgi:hypothetical protein
MYDVPHFVKPVPFDFERFPDLPNEIQELAAFRENRNNSTFGDLVRESFGDEKIK